MRLRHYAVFSIFEMPLEDQNDSYETKTVQGKKSSLMEDYISLKISFYHELMNTLI